MSHHFSPAEKYSFLIFLILCCLTLLSFHFFLTVGLAGILWGFLGFLRIAYLSEERYPAMPKAISLSSGLIYGLMQEQEHAKEFILWRLERWDILLWMSFAMFFLLWVLYVSVDPVSLSLVKTIALHDGIPIDLPISQSTDYYALANSMIYCMIIGIIILLAVSYSQNRPIIKNIIPALAAVFIAGFLALFFMHPIANPAILAELSVPKGGGAGKSDILGILQPELLKNSGTPLMRRFMEFGAVGAYGVYVLFIPAFVVLGLAFLHPQRNKIRPMIGFGTIGILGFSDVFLIASPWQQGLSLLGLVLFALCWGAAGPKKI